MIKNNKTLKAVLYARYSKNLIIDTSIEMQVREIRKYAEENNIEIIHEYIDTSETCNIKERHQFQKMIYDSESKEFDLILVYRFDRISRIRKESLFYKIDLKRNGVKVISVSEPISDFPESVFLESLLEAFAEYYSLNLAEDKAKIKETDGYLSQGGNYSNERHS